jgi:hypothetical protein
LLEIVVKLFVIDATFLVDVVKTGDHATVSFGRERESAGAVILNVPKSDALFRTLQKSVLLERCGLGLVVAPFPVGPHLQNMKAPRRYARGGGVAIHRRLYFRT